MKELYLAGKCAVLQEAFTGVRGVEGIFPGTAVAQDGLLLSGARIDYNPKKVDIGGILSIYFENVDPYAIADEPAEQAGIVYSSGEDIPQIEYYMRFLQSRGAEPGAALGSLILNDSITPGREIRQLQVRFGRLQKFSAE